MKKSLKCTVAVVILFAATLSANAQFENYSVPNRFHMGFHGGLSVNSFRGDGVENMSPLADFTGGISFDWQIGSNPLFIGFEINYLNEGYKCDRWGEKTRYDYSAVHVPLIAGYHFNIAPNLFISPYAGGFASYNVVHMDEYDSYDYWKSDRFNYGLRIGCGLNYGRLTFNLAYDLGLKNVPRDSYDGDKGYSGTFFATIGFNIVGSR